MGIEARLAQIRDPLGGVADVSAISPQTEEGVVPFVCRCFGVGGRGRFFPNFDFQGVELLRPDVEGARQAVRQVAASDVL